MSDTINPSDRNMLVMKASAGSGKTYNLALEYIKHLLFAPGEDGKLKPQRAVGDNRILNAHRKLLAITFTNKATDEMKQRIVKELYHLAQPGEESDYLMGFMKEARLGENEVRALARQALNELLFDYSNFNVSTIDSFFQAILRNFARELDRDFNYDIQLEEDYAVSVAVHNFLLSLGKTEQPTQVDTWVKEYQRHMLHGNPEARKWQFFKDGGDLTKFAKQINTEMFRSRMDSIRDYLGHVDNNGEFQSDFSTIRAFVKVVSNAESSCRATAEALLKSLCEELQPLNDNLNKKMSFKSLLNKGGKDPLSDALLCADRDKIKSQFLSKQMPSDDVIDRLLHLVTEYFKYYEADLFLTHVNNNLGLLGMLAMIDIFLEKYRHETNSILIGDTNELIGTVLDSGSDFVYERIGTIIAHFMIDEFQDTSTKQYENFRGLLKESLANGNFNMLIGDAKQSIYRFRNADPTVFRERVDNDFKDSIYSRTVKPGEPTSTNYRSSRGIIEFNNQLFEGMKSIYRDKATVQGTYADVEQGMPGNIDEKKVPGYVKLLLGDYDRLVEDQVIAKAVGVMKGGATPADSPAPAIPADPATPADSATPAKGKNSKDKKKELNVLDILPGYLLKLHERYDWGQIGVLVNTNNNGDSIVKAILEYNKRVSADRWISIISGESLLLSNSPVIRRIIAMLRFMDINPLKGKDDKDDATTGDDEMQQRLKRKRESDQRLYAALSAFIKEVSSDTDARDNGIKLDACMKTLSGAVPAAGEQPQPMQDLLARLLPPPGELTTLVSIVETIIAEFKRAESGCGDVDKETAFLLAFQDVVMKFSSQRNGGSIREFLKYWDEKKDSLAVSSANGGDAVNIMTIHKAKGLEFDCVVIPFADWDLTQNSKEHTYWMPRDAFYDATLGLPVDEPQWDKEQMPPLLNVNKKALLALNEYGMLSGEAKAFVEKQQSDVLIDNLNKTYVAFTRPRTELHILGKAPDSKKKLDPAAVEDLTELMSILAPTIMDPIPAPGAKTVSWYEYGQQSTREEIQAKLDPEDTNVKRENVIEYPVMPIPADLKVKVDNAASTRIQAGIRLHSLMSRIHDRDDVDHVIAMGVKHGIISNDPDDPCGIDNINNHVRAAIMDPHNRVSTWFDPVNKVYSERTIFTDLNTASKKEDKDKNPRPDRIIRLPDGQIVVIDYKSGKRNDREHLPQLEKYIRHLQTIFPCTPIAGRLWYTMLDLILDEQGHVMSNIV